MLFSPMYNVIRSVCWKGDERVKVIYGIVWMYIVSYT